MEEILKKILEELDKIRTDIDELRQDTNVGLDMIIRKIDEYHAENIHADNKLLELIQSTNDRLDFQRDKLAKAEEDLHVLKQKQ